VEPRGSRGIEAEKANVVGITKCYFEDVSLEVYDHERGEFKDVLYKVSGQLPQGRVLAVVGAEVGEANALLRVIGGRVGSGTWERSSGTFSIGTHVCELSQPNDLALRTAYVHDSMPLWGTQTPSEAFHFYARLRIHRGAFPSKSYATAEKSLRDLELTRVRDQQISKGLTTKQRWLTRLGMQMMAESIDLIVLEDMISTREDGLDEGTAYEVIHKARELARSSEGGPSVVLSLGHIPQKILPLIDRLLVIAKGQVVYNDVPKNLPDHIRKNGFTIPKYFDPLEHLLLIATGHVDTEAAQKLLTERDRERTDANDDDFSGDEAKTAQLEPWTLLRDIWRRRRLGQGQEEEDKALTAAKHNTYVNLQVPYTEPNYKTIRANACLQFLFLLRRDFKTMYRTFHHGIPTLLVMVLLLCATYYSLSFEQKDLTDRPACLWTTLTFLSIFFGLDCAVTFPTTHRLYEFERVRSNVYNTSIFVTSQFLVQLLRVSLLCALFCGVMKLACGLVINYWLFLATCVLSAMCFCSIGMIIGIYKRDPRKASTLMMLVFAPCIVLSDFFMLSWDSPSFIRWVYQINPLFQAYNILRERELMGQYFRCDIDDVCFAMNGEMFLNQNGLSDTSSQREVIILLIHCAILRLLLPIILWIRLREYGVAIT